MIVKERRVSWDMEELREEHPFPLCCNEICVRQIKEERVSINVLNNIKLDLAAMSNVKLFDP